MSEPKTPTRLERYGMIGLLVVQFGYHELAIKNLEATNREQGSAIASVVSATDERRDAVAQALTRIEAAQNESGRAVRDLRDTVIELRAMTRRPR